MLATSTLHVPTLTREWLTSRTFTFRAEQAANAISETFTLHRNGFIAGYSHPNERFWDIEGDTLRILDHHGKPTCIMKARVSENGRRGFGGFFYSPGADYEVTNVTHVLEENDSDYHTRIQSFDLFDTLVARRCYEPLAVFRNVEAKSGVANFAARRHAVEMSIFGRRTYGLEDIYGLLVAEAFLTKKQASVLLLMELEEEWDTLIPIAEVIANVNPDDIVISDMYLPYAFVKRVLKEKCGLDNKLYLSNYGKHQKQIWPGILAQYALRSHFGDNIHADIVGPSTFGIQPILVSISKWNKTEEVLHAAGLGEYAHILRQTRLQTFDTDRKIANALTAQLTVNIPLMLLGTFWIRHCVESFGADKILTAARDCNLWHEMLTSTHFARFGVPPTTYLKISRALCHGDSDAYEAYLRGNLGQRTLLVDMVGTGKSLAALIERLDLRERIQPCILVADPQAPAKHPMIDAFILKDFFACRIFMAALNASLEGSAAAAVSDQNGSRILSQPNEFSDAMRDTIAASRSLFQRFLTDLNTIRPPRDIPALPVLRAAADVVVAQLADQVLKLESILLEQGSNLRRSSIANVVNG